MTEKQNAGEQHDLDEVRAEVEASPGEVCITLTGDDGSATITTTREGASRLAQLIDDKAYKAEFLEKQERGEL